MTALWIAKKAEPLPVKPLSEEALAYVNFLRFASMTCRCMRKTDLFQACALLHADRSASRDAYASALMRCLEQALGKRARVLAPGAREMSFDEKWLLQLGLASARGDEASVAFLLKSRVKWEHRRLIRFLIGQISECLYST
jgi:hypothetical protein